MSNVDAILRCPKCNTQSYYYRSKTDDYVCRKCGTVFTDPDTEKLGVRA